ncbi:MxaK protein [Methylobacterium sp. C25]|uniref:MxaK protein n=1 Tax=Methylobacterium sp. C25 TaxID=2721622 RepID=UPI001F3BA0B0|nr:MxaK protein [Methylobacterium sp. C25]MCE4224501.1 MxaK protein [Methylobacterium sp. C25]
MSSGPLALSGSAPLARLGALFASGLRRLRPSLLLALPILLALAALACAGLAWRTAQANCAIADLAGNRDVAVSTEAPSPILVARILFLARRDRLEEAETLVQTLERRDEADGSARARYAMANSRLRQAFGHLSRNDIDPAGPLVILARQDYRRALQARPDFWDAKYNLDVASRLIRDFPDFDRKHGDDLKAEPKKIWTDIPGQPRGAP